MTQQRLRIRFVFVVCSPAVDSAADLVVSFPTTTTAFLNAAMMTMMQDRVVVDVAISIGGCLRYTLDCLILVALIGVRLYRYRSGC